jgi:hypothetical protein
VAGHRSRRPSPPGTRGRERGNRRKGSAPRRRSLLSSLDPCPASLAIQTSQTPGGRASGSPAARRASSMTLGAWHCTVRLVYGVLHGFILPVWRGMGSRPRRAHSRLGGAAVVTGSGEVAPKLHGLSGPRRITPLSTDKTMPLTSSIFETLVHFLQLGAKRPNCSLGTVGISQISPRRRSAAIPPDILAPASDLAGAASCRMQAPAP